MTKVQIAAQSALVRAGIEAMLGEGFTIDDSDPDVVVADADGLDEDALANLAAADIPVLALTSDRAEIPELLRSGFRGAILHNAGARQLQAAIEATAAGLVVQGAGPPLNNRTALASALTHREVEVLRLLADGGSNKSIAWKLGISEHTVKFHVASIMGKLDAGSRAEAVARGIQMGLVLI